VAFAIDVGDFEVRVADGDEGGELEVAGFEDGGSLDVDFDALELGAVIVDLQDEVFEVEDDRGDVFLDALEGGEFVAGAFDLDGDYARAGKGGEQDAAEGVAEGDAEASFERLGNDFGIVLVLIVDRDGDLDGFERVREFDFSTFASFCLTINDVPPVLVSNGVAMCGR
jgi:hypothetical protein